MVFEMPVKSLKWWYNSILKKSGQSMQLKEETIKDLVNIYRHEPASREIEALVPAVWTATLSDVA